MLRECKKDSLSFIQGKYEKKSISSLIWEFLFICVKIDVYIIFIVVCVIDFNKML